MTQISEVLHDVMKVLDEFVGLCHTHSRKIAHITGLSETQVAILKEVYYCDDVSFTKLIKKLNISPYKTNQLVDGLMRKNLLQRTKNEDDKRAWTLQLTNDGNNILTSINAVREKLIMKFSSLPNWHQAQILATLHHLSDILEA